jgi:hypothetical protein
MHGRRVVRADIVGAVGSFLEARATRGHVCGADRSVGRSVVGKAGGESPAPAQGRACYPFDVLRLQLAGESGLLACLFACCWGLYTATVALAGVRRYLDSAEG